MFESETIDILRAEVEKLREALRQIAAETVGGAIEERDRLEMIHRMDDIARKALDIREPSVPKEPEDANSERCSGPGWATMCDATWEGFCSRENLHPASIPLTRRAFDEAWAASALFPKQQEISGEMKDRAARAMENHDEKVFIGAWDTLAEIGLRAALGQQEGAC